MCSSTNQLALRAIGPCAAGHVQFAGRAAAFLFVTLLAVAVIAEQPVSPATDSATAPSLDRLAWLAGDWISDTRGTIVEERWLAPRGGLMVGVNRTVNAKVKAQFEYLRIEERAGQVTFFASPQGRPATPFRATRVTADRATFENRENDFPHTIEYWREGELLRARIEGPLQGKVVSMEWTWKPAGQDGPATKK